MSFNRLRFLSFSLILPLIMQAVEYTSHIKIIYTTDVHGSFFPTDYMTMSPVAGGLARVAAAVDSLRVVHGDDRIILLDNGDILQGQPTVYYYNYIDTESKHIVNDIYEIMRYDAVSLGNHDIEAGHQVYDRIHSASNIPMLAANITDANTGEPYFSPYTIIDKSGIKVAVIGLITPAIPSWLPENLWSGLKFEPMIESAEKWIEIVKNNENPDVIIGLFHSGNDSTKKTADYIENASRLVAEQVPGFDAVLMGHDHQRHQEILKNSAGNDVHLLNPANNAMAVGIVDVSVVKDNNGQVLDKKINSEIADVTFFKPSHEFMTRLAYADSITEEFVSRKIGSSHGRFFSGDAYFGCSSFMSLLHRLQLAISGADISFAAPLSFNAEIKEGDLQVSDMFSLYKYENTLYTMRMTGQEIKDYLEESYSLWTRVVTDKQKHLIDFVSVNPSPIDNRFKNPTYNFDSAAGINYTVDITKPEGEKIIITSLSSGEPFELTKDYTVAVNSYRGNGGGDLMTKGAGISKDDLRSRVISSTDKDLRYYLLKHLEQEKDIFPQVDCNWRFIPEDIATKAIAIDRKLLFGPESKIMQK